MLVFQLQHVTQGMEATILEVVRSLTSFAHGPECQDATVLLFSECVRPYLNVAIASR